MNEEKGRNEKQSRRNFVKQISSAGMGLSLLVTPWAKLMADSGIGANNKIRLAIIGSGDRGRFLLEHYLVIQKQVNIEMVALCDNYQPSLDAALAICEKYDVSPTTYSNHLVLLEKEKLDGVLVATPLYQHAHITIDALNSGIHVFCEKAMARTMEDTKKMYETHLKTGKILQIGHQRYFDPKFQTAVDQIQSGKLGEVGQIRAYWHRNNNWRRAVPAGHPELEHKINWRLYKEYSAGLLTELMSHHTHVATWLMQQAPVSVMGTGGIRYWKDGREVYDNVALIFSYEDGTQFIYDSMTSNKKYGLQMQVMGDKGTMELETNHYFAEKPPAPPAAPGILQLINDIETGLFEKIPIGSASWIPETAVKYKGETIVENTSGDGSVEQLIAFANFIREGSIPAAFVHDAYVGNLWTMLSEKAIETGMKLEMPEEFKI